MENPPNIEVRKLSAESGAREGGIHQPMAKAVWKQVKDGWCLPLAYPTDPTITFKREKILPLLFSEVSFTYRQLCTQSLPVSVLMPCASSVKFVRKEQV